MSRPTEYPEWASGGGAVLVDPLLAKKQLGWVDQEKPAGPYMNWWQNLVYKWVQFLDAATGIGMFGDGSDGSATLDGVAVVPWATLTGGNLYTLTRDPQLVNLTINNGIKLKVNSAANGCFVIYGQGLLDLSLGGEIDGDGDSSSVVWSNLDNAPWPSGTVHAGGFGGRGANISAPPGHNGASVTNAYGGAGGAAGNTGGVSGTGGTTTPPSAAHSKVIPIINPGHLQGTDAANSAVHSLMMGGAGGGGGCWGASENPGGTGGAGGAHLAIRFASIKHGAQALTKVHAFGHAGAPGAAPVLGGANNGGGGGAGGLLDVVCITKDVGPYTVASVAGGAGGAGTGGAAAGAAGGVGQVHEVSISAVVGIAPPAAHPPEGGVIVLTGVEAAAAAVFAIPFGDVPGNVGGYRFEWSIARTDGVAGVPSIVLSSCTTLGMGWTIIDQFAGYISWRAVPTS
jgi:hypothetical protein